MIGMAALHELGVRLRDGDCTHHYYAHPLVVGDEPIYQAARGRSASLVAEAAGCPPEQVRTFYFSPTYLAGVVRRRHTSFLAPDPMTENYGVILAVWQRP